MRVSRTVLALLLVAAHTMGAPAPAACGATTDKMDPWRAGDLRGVNLWQGRWGGTSGPYPGRAIGSPVTDADVAAIRSLGANYVQLSVAGPAGERSPYASDPAVVAVIDDLVGRLGRAGLFVVLAFRSGPGRNEQAIGRLTDTAVYGPILEDVWSNETAQDAWMAMLRAAAARWGGDPAVIGIDPMMEPNASARRGFPGPAAFFARYGGTLEDVNRFNARAVAAIRQVSDVPVLVEGDGYAAPSWLPWLAETGDPRSVYTTHDYEPFAYTQQTAGSPVPYPGPADTLAPLRAFAERGLPVAVTEFGVRRYAPGAAMWLTDALDAFDRMRASHALWEFVVDAQRPLFNDFDPEGGPDPAVRAVVPNAVHDVVAADLARACVRPFGPVAEPASTPVAAWMWAGVGALVAAAAAAWFALRRRSGPRPPR